MRISIIIVNYGTAELTIDCIASVQSDIACHESIQVIVVDNASPDESAIVLARAIRHNGWERSVTLLTSQVNGGFAYGNNIGIRKAFDSTHLPDYVLLLNPDTIVRPDTINRLCEFLKANPEVGIAGGNILGKDGTPLHCAHCFPSPMQQFEETVRLGIVSRWLRTASVEPGYPNNIQCDWVSGACMMVRRQVIEQIGDMDEEFFLYFEEVDYCRRAKSAKWQVWYVADAEVVHLVGASTDVNAEGKRRPRYWYDSRLRYFNKHFGMLGAILADVFCCLGVVILRVRRKFSGIPNIETTPMGFLRDMILYRFRPNKKTRSNQ